MQLHVVALFLVVLMVQVRYSFSSYRQLTGDSARHIPISGGHRLVGVDPEPSGAFRTLRSGGWRGPGARRQHGPHDALRRRRVRRGTLIQISNSCL